jgi:hypothetical protein
MGGLAEGLHHDCLEYQRIWSELRDDYGPAIVRATRDWIQYGIFGFAVLCIVVGAVEALFGR